MDGGSSGQAARSPFQGHRQPPSAFADLLPFPPSGGLGAKLAPGLGAMKPRDSSHSVGWSTISPASSAPLPEDSWQHRNEHTQAGSTGLPPDAPFVTSQPDSGSLLGAFEGSAFDTLSSVGQLNASPPTGQYAWPGSSPPYSDATLGPNLSPRSSGSTIPAHFRQPSQSHLSTGTHLRSLSSLHRDLPPRPAPSAHMQDSIRLQQQQHQQQQQQPARPAADTWGNPFAGMDHFDSAPRPLPVDQVAEEAVDMWFAEADSTRTGLVSGGDAVKFFSRSGLSQPDLSRVWNVVKAMTKSTGPGLCRTQFSAALRLVALAQKGYELTDANCEAALDPVSSPLHFGGLLPPPNLRHPSPSRTGGAAEGSPPSGTSPARGPVAGHHNRDSLESAFVNLAVSRPPPVSSPIISHKSPASSSPESLACGGNYNVPPKPVVQAIEPPPVCFEARLPPLHPSLSAQLSLLAAGHGSLFAAPSRRGGVLQWGRPEGNMRRPVADVPETSTTPAELENAWAADGEDADAAPACEWTDGKKVTCMHVDEAGAMLWTGHADGRVCGFWLGGSPGSAINTRRKYSWQAHRLGKVTAMGVSGWGELWTGSSRGSIRVWPISSYSSSPGESAAAPGSTLRELRRSGGGRPHGGDVTAIAFPSGGQVVWTSGEKSLLLWCAFSGLFLGSIHHGDADDSDLVGPGRLRREDGDKEEKRLIDPKKGLDLDTSGRASSKPHFLARDKHTAEQEGWAQQSDKKTSEFLDSVQLRGGQAFSHAGKAAKFIGRLVTKQVRNVVEDRANLSLPGRPNSATGMRNVAPGNAADLASDWGSDAGDFESEAGSFRERGGERVDGQKDQKSGNISVLIPTSDGQVWVVYKKGRLEKYSAYGKLLMRKDVGPGVTVMAPVGHRLWAGTSQGCIRVLQPGGVFHQWRAYREPVIAICPCGSRVYTLSEDGALKGWSSDLPGPHMDACRAAFNGSLGECIERRSLEVVCLTWNVAEGKPDPLQSNFFRWLAKRAASAAIVVVGLQEIEMGGGSVAMAAARDRFAKLAQEKGNANGQWWEKQVLAALGDGRQWVRVGMRQLSGMLVLVFARAQLQGAIGEVRTASVACGVLGVGGNKGAAAVAFSLFRRQVSCVCSHFAAHQTAIEARNKNYAQIVRQLKFSRKKAQAEPEEYDPHQRGGNDSEAEDSDNDSNAPDDLAAYEPAEGQGMRDAELLVWMGDFNYRVDESYEKAKELIRHSLHTRAALDELLDKDQLRREMKANRVFHWLHEAAITFRPTYKFDRGETTECAYDSSEKRRVPAWCDRILFRGSDRQYKDSLEDEDEEAREMSCLMASEDSTDDEVKGGKPDEIRVRSSAYNACMDVFDSDHKPVWASLAVDIPIVHHDKCRRLASHVLKAITAKSTPPVPLVKLSAYSISLRQVVQNTAVLGVTNEGVAPVTFRVCRAIDEASGRDGEAGIPSWLEVYPLDGVLAPMACTQITLAAAVPSSVSYSRIFKCALRLRLDHEFGRGGARTPQHAKADQVVQVRCQPEGASFRDTDE